MLGRPEEIDFEEAVNAIGTENVSLFLFPNPVNERLNIDLNDSFIEGPVTIELFDVLGKVAQSFSINLSGGRTTLDLSELTTGVYTLRATLPNGHVRAAKVSKQ